MSPTELLVGIGEISVNISRGRFIAKGRWFGRENTQNLLMDEKILKGKGLTHVTKRVYVFNRRFPQLSIFTC